MSRLSARRTALALVAGALVAFPAPALAAGTTVPSAPRAPYAYPGVDGVRLYWSAPLDSGGGLNGYRIYRAADANPPDTLLAEIAATSTRTYLDSAGAAGTWTYAITAVNDAGESVRSTSKTVTIPAPVEAGTVDALALDGGAGTWTDGGSWAFVSPADSVQVTSYDATRFILTGVSTSSSPQGAKTIGLNVGSMVDGNRPVPGQTYPLYSSMYGPTPPAGALVLNPVVNGCTTSSGSLTVDEASFEADGRPLVFSARFVYQCAGGPVYGTIRWHAHDGVEAVTQSRGPLDFGQAPALATTGPAPLVLHNAGQSAQQLGQATVTGTHAAEFTLDSDTCSGISLAPGATCELGVAVTPADTGSRTARLQLTDGTAHGMRDVPLSVDAVSTPGAPPLSATGAYRAVKLSWQYPATDAPITAYRVYRGVSADALELVAELPGTQATMVQHYDRAVTPGATYHYAVTAANVAGEGGRSGAVAGTALTAAVVYATDEFATGDDYTIAMVTDSGVRERITTAGADHDLPAVSPDGSEVVYTSNAGSDDGYYSLWVQPVSGGSARRLTSGSAYDDAFPSWSPDGSRIAFTRITANSRSVYVVPAAGGTPTAVPGTSGDLAPSWAPNGRMLAVNHVAELGGDEIAATIVVTSLDGRYRRLVAGTSGNGLLSWDPSWSPDGTRIAFVRQTSSGLSQVATVPATGGTATLLTPANVIAVSTDWSPEGSRIVYEKLGFYADSLWSVAPAGGASTAVPSGGYDQVSPAGLGVRLAYSPVAVPAPVTGLGATLGSGTVTLSWNAAAGAAYYVVRRSGAGGAAPATPEDGVQVYAGTARTASAKSLGNGSAYAFSVFAVSSTGDAGAKGTRRAAPAATPTVTPNGSVLSALYGNGPRFVVRWGTALTAGQVYDVQRGVRAFNSTSRTWGAPVWSAWQSGTTASSAVLAAAAGTTYHLRARVRDAFGNVTPWSAVAVDPVPYDDRAMTATGAWSAVAASGRFAGTLRVSGAAGAKLTYSAYGSAFGLVADRCAACGQVKVYVDGVHRATVDTRASTTLPHQVVWSTRFAGIGRHTLAFVVVGTPGRPAVRVDGLTATR